MSAARERWLDAGLQALEDGGAAALRIDRIAARLGLSKGSFHHHFAGAADYRRAVLAHHERSSVAALSEAVTDDADPATTLRGLTELVSPTSALYRPRLDVAVRAWATWDDDARATQASVDAARVAALERVWRRLTPDAADARRRALLPYLIAVGASVVEPPVDADEIREVFRLLLPLVPGADDASG